MENEVKLEVARVDIRGGVSPPRGSWWSKIIVKDRVDLNFEKFTEVATAVSRGDREWKGKRLTMKELEEMDLFGLLKGCSVDQLEGVMSNFKRKRNIVKGKHLKWNSILDDGIVRYKALEEKYKKELNKRSMLRECRKKESMLREYRKRKRGGLDDLVEMIQEHKNSDAKTNVCDNVVFVNPYKKQVKGIKSKAMELFEKNEKIKENPYKPRVKVQAADICVVRKLGNERSKHELIGGCGEKKGGEQRVIYQRPVDGYGTEIMEKSKGKVIRLSKYEVGVFVPGFGLP